MSQAVELLLDAFGGGPDPSEERVNAATAQKMSAVYACIRLIAETAGSLPFAVHRELAGGELIAEPGHRISRTLRTPNELVSGQVRREQEFKSLLLWGNTYTEIVRLPEAGGLELYGLQPDRTRPHIDGRRVIYETTDDNGNPRTLFPSEILHVPLLPEPGQIVGNPPPVVARTAIGIALAAQKHDARFFAQGALGALGLELPRGLDDPTFNRLRQEIKEARQSGRGVITFEQGTKPHDLKQEFAALLPIRKWQILEVARYYGVPPMMIGEQEKGAPKSSVEEQEREFAKHTLRPVLKRFEAEYDRKLLPDDGSTPRRVIRHDLRELLAADTKTTWWTYSIGRQMGFYSVNEVRRFLGMPGIGPAGDQHLSPVNLDKIPRAIEAQLDRAFRATTAELLAGERREMLDIVAGGNGNDLASRSAELYKPDRRARIAEALRAAGNRFASQIMAPLGLPVDTDRFGRWAELTADRHTTRALEALETDPLEWLAGGSLRYDAGDALDALVGGNGNAES